MAEFELSEYYRERLQKIREDAEMRGERFAASFRFYFIGFLLFFATLSRLGGRPVKEFYIQLGAIALLFVYNTVLYFVLRRSQKYYGQIKYVSSLLEISILSFMLGYLAWSQKNPSMVFSGAIPYIYFILIALASIRNSRPVIVAALVASLLQFGALCLYFLGPMTVIGNNIAGLTAQIAPELAAEGRQFHLVSVTPMGVALKLIYMLVAGWLIVYALLNAKRTANSQSSLIFNTEKEAILQEKEKSDYLLLNILPDSVAAELKEKGATTPQKFAAISVLFTDFKGFTNIAEQLSPEELVAELDTCFRHFDGITEKYGLEKIKTIGDAYMCAGGIPRGNTTHAVDCVLAGLEIQSFMQEQKRTKHALGKLYWELRLGINTGDVVAGVVGKKKFAYDIWGDTVNTASRMESSGIPGLVNISEATYNEVQDFFICQYRGEIEAKNKGKIKMYFVHGIRPSLSEDGRGLSPNSLFARKLDVLRGEITSKAS